ncbi:MAG TPA: HEPN domain-containing protein [Pyrinomonadaceae bacterium]|nr:HEPN domain-containing protein [Pyrinomonadaceae bacterium]
MNERPTPDSPEAWLLRARSDLALARAVLNLPDVLREDACFHAQQCAEKSLKALLVHLAIPYQRTHALETLIDLMKASGVDVPPEVDQSFSSLEMAATVLALGGGAAS